MVICPPDLACKATQVDSELGIKSVPCPKTIMISQISSFIMYLQKLRAGFWFCTNISGALPSMGHIKNNAGYQSGYSWVLCW